MSDQTEGENPERRWPRLWRWLHQWYLLWIPVGGTLMTEAFCIS